MEIPHKQQLIREHLTAISVEQSLEAFADKALTSILEGVDAEIAQHARNAIRHAMNDVVLPPAEMYALEAIIIPGERPVIDIDNDKYAWVGPPFEHLNEPAAREIIEPVLPSIGRIDLPHSPNIPFAGTGFVIADNLLMTNRHVAELFSSGLGRHDLRFRSGHTALVDFKREVVDDRADYIAIRKIKMIHPYWDMAIVEVEGLDPGRRPLRLSTESPQHLLDHDIAIIGYPALDSRNNIALQNDIFGGRFNVKRLQPGKLRARNRINSFGNAVDALTHDSSTLGGNSGSAVLDVRSGEVIGLHFAGQYLVANYAVATADMATDSVVVDTGANFTSAVNAVDGPWLDYWRNESGSD